MYGSSCKGREAEADGGKSSLAWETFTSIPEEWALIASELEQSKGTVPFPRLVAPDNWRRYLLVIQREFLGGY